MPRPRLVFVTTLPVTADLLLRGQLGYLREQGFDVHVVTSPGPGLDRVREREGVTVHPLPMAREIDPISDARSLASLVALFRRLKPDIVNASTPKGGMLGMMAARTVGVPVRVYLVRGLRLETTAGGLRSVLSQTERLTSACATEVVCVSESLRTAYVPVFVDDARVLGSGSSNGVRSDRFAPSPQRDADARSLAESVGLDERLRIGFAGRLVEDKGIRFLLEAFERVRATVPASLVLVGDDLAGDRVADDIRTLIQQDPDIHLLPRMNELGAFYRMIDVLAFPSLREGFPNVPLEAARAGRPVVGFASTGVVDAVVHGVTGILVPTGDTEALADALIDQADADLREALGNAGLQRAKTDFAPERIWSAWVDLYDDALRMVEGPSRQNKPRILHVLPYDLARGAQVYARAMVDALQDRGMDHQIVALFEGDPGILDPDICLEVPRTPFRRFGFDPRASIRLSEHLEAEPPDVIVTHGAEPLKYVLPCDPDAPIIHYRIGISAVKSGPRLELLARQHRAADWICGVSNETLDDAVALFGVEPTRCTLIANGRDPQRYRPAKRLGDTPVLLFLGAFAPTKRPEVFVEVVRRLQLAGVEFHAQMIGDGVRFDDIAPSARALNIELLGRREDVPDLLPAASVFLFTSVPEGEGMPGVFIEAGFCGVPTVATRVPGASTVIEHGTTGFVVDHEDIDGLVMHCKTLLEDASLVDTMGAAAVERCLGHFTLQQSFDTWHHVLERVVAS